MWNKKEEECFRCSKKNILSVCNVAQSWMDATSLQKMKNINPSKYRFLKNMLKPHEKSLEKLANSKVSIHEKKENITKTSSRRRDLRYSSKSCDTTTKTNTLVHCKSSYV